MEDWDRLGRGLPCLVNLMPSGEHLMEDFYYAGGLAVVLRELGKAGLVKIYIDHVNQADEGADLDILVGAAARRCRASRIDRDRGEGRVTLEILAVL